MDFYFVATTLQFQEITFIFFLTEVIFKSPPGYHRIRVGYVPVSKGCRRWWWCWWWYIYEETRRKRRRKRRWGRERRIFLWIDERTASMRAGILITHAILPSFSPSSPSPPPPRLPWHSPWLALACYPTTPTLSNARRPPPVARSRYAVVTCRGGVNTRAEHSFRTFANISSQPPKRARLVLDIVRNRRVFPEVTLEEASCPWGGCYHTSSRS